MLSSRTFRYLLNLILLLGGIILVTGFARANKASSESTQVAKADTASQTFPDEVTRFYPMAAGILQEDSTRTIVMDAKARQLGYLLYTSPYTDYVEGYNGPTPVAIAFGADDRILGTMLLEHDETPSFARRVEKAGLYESWNGKTAEEALAEDVDAVSGATYTSEAVITCVQKRLEIYIGQKKNKKADVWGIVRTGGTIAVILMALGCFFFPSKAKPFRLYLLALSVVFLGFLKGTFLSLESTYHWLSTGFPFATQWLLIGLFALAVLLPLITNKPFYCRWVCPFGAAQELMGKLSRRKLHIPPQWIKALTSVRRYLLLIVVVLLIFNVAGDLSKWEPFAAFSFRSASVWVLVLAGLMLLASVLVQQPWCRFFCPTGQLLESVRKCSPRNLRHSPPKN